MSAVTVVSTYQLFPPLSAEEYEALKADIAARGVMVPVEYDQDGNILDGHHRVQIAAELGIDYPRLIRPFTTEDEKVEHILALNLSRRHLSVEQKLEVVKALRERGMSVRKIAETTGIPKSTVGRYVAPAVPHGTPELGDADYPLYLVLRCLLAAQWWEDMEGERLVGLTQRVVRGRRKERVAPIPPPDLIAEFEADLENFEDVVAGGWVAFKTGKVPAAPDRWWTEIRGRDGGFPGSTGQRDQRFAVNVHWLLCGMAAGGLLNWLGAGGDPDQLGIRNEPIHYTDEELQAFLEEPETIWRMKP